jgi:hypothetical protein
MAVFQGTNDVEEFQKPEVLSHDASPQFYGSRTGCYDDLESRWNKEDEIDGKDRESNAIKPTQVGVILLQENSMFPIQATDASLVDVSSRGESQDDGPPYEYLSPEASRWIIQRVLNGRVSLGKQKSRRRVRMREACSVSKLILDSMMKWKTYALKMPNRTHLKRK